MIPHTQADVMNYDPNMTTCGHLAKQTIRLTFGQWEYRETFEITVRGNMTGLEVIASAVESLYASLPCEYFDEEGKCKAMASIQLGELECSDEDCLGEQWLGEMLIAAEIISMEPDGMLS